MNDRHASRRSAVAEQLAGLGAAALLVTDLRNVAYLTGFHGSAGVVLLYAGKDVGAAFDMVTTVSATCFMFVWSIILASYLVFRKRRPQLHDASAFKMPGGRVMVWVVYAFFAFVLWALTTQPDTLTALAVTPIWFALLGVAWLVLRRRSAHRARFAQFRATLREDEAERAEAGVE